MLTTTQPVAADLMKEDAARTDYPRGFGKRPRLPIDRVECQHAKGTAEGLVAITRQILGIDAVFMIGAVFTE